MNYNIKCQNEGSELIMNSKEQYYRAKQEADPSDCKFSKTTPSSSRQWAGFRNPRIVRVSRTFGGKDRHSKVCTVRGLRDRRIRLSVPTAIQLYDLQDRLGLSQPSKVVDWLLDATKTEIDKLPPLQMPPGNLSQFFQPLTVSSSHQQSSSSSQSSFPHFSNQNPIKINDQTMVDHQRSTQNDQQELLQAQNFFPPTANQLSTFPSFLNNAFPFNNPYYHLEPANLSLSQFGNHSFPIQAEDHHSAGHINYSSSSMAIPSTGSQFYFCPSGAAPPTMIPPLPLPPYMKSTSAADPRQINHFQFLSSTSQNVLPNSLMPTLHLISSPMKSHTLNVNPRILHPQGNDSNKPEKEGTGS